MAGRGIGGGRGMGAAEYTHRHVAHRWVIEPVWSDDPIVLQWPGERGLARSKSRPPTPRTGTTSISSGPPIRWVSAVQVRGPGRSVGASDQFGSMRQQLRGGMYGGGERRSGTRPTRGQLREPTRAGRDERPDLAGYERPAPGRCPANGDSGQSGGGVVRLAGAVRSSGAPSGSLLSRSGRSPSRSGCLPPPLGLSAPGRRVGG